MPCPMHTKLGYDSTAVRLMDDFVSPLKGLQLPTVAAEKAPSVGLNSLAGLLQHPAKNIRCSTYGTSLTPCPYMNIIDGVQPAIRPYKCQKL